MSKYLLVLSTLLFFNFCLAQQTKMNFYLLNKIQNNPETNINVLVKCDEQSIKEIANKYNLTVTHGNDNIYSVSGKGINLMQAAKEKGIKRMEHFKSNLQVLDDSSLVKNNIHPVHNGGTPLTLPGYKGKNVVIGVIDTGLDFGHPDFKDSLGNTRVKFLWDQKFAVASNTPQPYNYGQEWDSLQIMLGNCTSTDYTNGGHGTKVTGVAAGNGISEFKYRGIAPEADIIFVAIDFSNTTNQTISDAVNYIYEKANQLGKPCVINCSLGDYYGSHDGTDLQAQYIGGLAAAQPGRAMVAANGNAGNSPFHLGYSSTNDTSFTWLTNASNQLVFDVYADSAEFANLKLTIGVRDNNFNYKTNFGFRDIDSSLGVIVYDTLRFGGNKIGDIFTYTDYSNGLYTFSCLINADSLNYLWSFETAGTGKIDSWNFDWKSSALPSPTLFPEMMKYKRPDTLQTMCTSFQCSDDVLSVGNYVGRNSYRDVRDTLYFFPGVVDSIWETSSYGPTRDLRTKPDICATGENIVTVGERTFMQWLTTNYPYIVTRDSMHMIFGGSSASSPVVAGLAALYFEANPTATNQMLKQDIINCAKTDTFTGSVPNHLWGNGKLNGFGCTYMQPTFSS
jgi:subtilisin family serine protease